MKNKKKNVYNSNTENSSGVTERASQIRTQGFSNTVGSIAKRKVMEVARTCKITAQVQQLENTLTWELSALNLQHSILQSLIYLDFGILAVC